MIHITIKCPTYKWNMQPGKAEPDPTLYSSSLHQQMDPDFANPVVPQLTQNDGILQYPFEAMVGVPLYVHLRDVIKPKKGQRFLFLATAPGMKDAVNQYMVYSRFDYKWEHNTVTTTFDSRWLETMKSDPVEYVFVDVPDVAQRLTAIVGGLLQLSPGGHLLVNHHVIIHKAEYQLACIVACLFDTCHIVDTNDVVTTQDSLWVYSGYKSMESTVKAELVKAAGLLGAGGLQQVADGQFSTESYKEYTRLKFLVIIRQQATTELAKEQALHVATKYKLDIKDWAYGEHAYFMHVYKQYQNIAGTTLRCFSSVQLPTLGAHSNVTLKVDLIDLLHKSESTYKYMDKINYEKFKHVELFFNNQYKNMNRELQTKYGITINGKVVTRAWVKLYELLSETQVLEPFYGESELRVMHLCEAPGNFINSLDNFVKTKTPIKKLNWKAQSLSHEFADFYDTYGFIRQTRDRWDLGDGTGDITKEENVKHYVKAYTGIDLMVADCGEKWSPDSGGKNLGVFQLLYALLLPRVGGSAIMKTFAVHIDPQYLALLYVLCGCYKKVQVFYSGTNFWSPEIYIVAEHFNGLSSEDKQVVETIAFGAAKGDTKYPVAVVPDGFLKEFYDIMVDRVSQMVEMKKMFVFLALNPSVFQKYRPDFQRMISKKNDEWMAKYMGKTK